MILIITGNGKGKTTSALGTAMRAAGWGKTVILAFFDKGGSHYGEQNILDLWQERIPTLRFGKMRFDEEARTFRFENTQADKDEAKRGLEEVQKHFKDKPFLIVCDELINCLNLGLIEEKELRAFLSACPQETHLVLTGRNVPEWLAEKADLISEINERKHYYKKVKDAVKGLDY